MQRPVHHGIEMAPLRSRCLRIFLIGLLALGSAFAAGERPEVIAPDTPPALAYTFTARPGPDSLEFSVQVTMHGDGSGRTKLVLPSHWGGQERLYDGIRDRRAEGGVLEEGDSPSERILVHEPGAQVSLTYRFVQDREADFSDPGRTHRPLRSPDYFHFIGHGAFVCPAWDEVEPRDIELRWLGLPEDWTLANSFGEGDGAQHLHVSIDQLRHALYVGGDFRIRRMPIHDRPLVVALRGSWRFEDDAFTSFAASVVASQREFWNDFEFPHFLITLIPTGTECCSFGGTSVTNAFAMFIATDGGLDMKMKRLLAHELLHTWIGQKMRNDSAPGRPESLLYWFSEGFTDYYTRELLLRSGQITAAEYVEDLNRALYDYTVSPVRNEPNSRIADDYWKDRFVQKLPYLRGELLARRWNAAIRRRSSGKTSLDDLMKGLLAKALAGGGRIGFSLIDEAARARIGPEAGEDLDSFVRKGGTIPVTPAGVPDGYTLERKEMSPFDLGFDFDTSRRSGSVAGVRSGGPAWKAGLRDGQPLKGFGIHWDDASRPVVIRVEIGGRVEERNYLPQGEAVLVPQLVEKPSP